MGTEKKWRERKKWVLVTFEIYYYKDTVWTERGIFIKQIHVDYLLCSSPKECYADKIKFQISWKLPKILAVILFLEGL